jgi:hypothetical protein
MPNRRLLPWCIATGALLSVAFAQSKRPLNHNDYDGWKSIVSQKLSNDGKFLAYGLFPQEGEGEVVVRNLVTGKEQRQPAGMRPAPVPNATPEEGPPNEASGVTILFSADSKTLVFSTFPPKADVDRAKKDKKSGPKDGMAIVDLASGKVARFDRVKRFAMPEKANGFLAYWKEGPDAPAGGGSNAPPAEPGEDQQGGRGGRGGAAGGRGLRAEIGSDFIIRTLADGSERTIQDVAEFVLADDGKQLVYAIGARDNTKNGVFAVKPNSSDAAATIADGKGKYNHLTWDETQTELAFLTDRDDQSSKPPKYALYRWDRQSGQAVLVASTATPGFRKELVISDKGNINFSKDGSRIFFATAPPAPEKPAATDVLDDAKAVVDLWSFRDDYIQPIQKVRAERDRNRTFIAAYLVD